MRATKGLPMNFIAQHIPETILTAIVALWIGVVAWAYNSGLGSDDDR